MDSLTQIVLGAAVGEAVAGKQLGIKAALFGAIAGTIPDLDVFLRSFYNPLDAALVHRGFSHSLLFALLAGPALAWLSNALQKTKLGFRKWFWFWFLGIVTHPLLDIFTNYGTQFFYPLTKRITFNSVFVIDPLYTLPFLFCLIVAICLKRTNPKRNRWNWIGILYSSGYLLYGVVIKLILLSQTVAFLDKSGIKAEQTMVTPMPLTSFYWTVIAKDQDTLYVTYKSLFKDYAANDLVKYPLKQGAKPTFELDQNLKAEIEHITNGYYTQEWRNDSLFINDFRFGTADKISSGVNKSPLMGFVFTQTKNGEIHIESIRNRRFDQIDFWGYWDYVFGRK